MVETIGDLNFTRTSPAQGYIVKIRAGETFGFSNLMDYSGYYATVYGPWQETTPTFQGDKAAAALIIPVPIYLLDEDQTSQALIDFYTETGAIIARFDGSPQFTAKILSSEDGYTNPTWYNLPTLSELRLNISAEELAKYSASGELEISALTTDIAGHGYRQRQFKEEPFGPTLYFYRSDIGLSAYWTDDTEVIGTDPFGDPIIVSTTRLSSHFVVRVGDQIFTEENDTVSFLTDFDPSLLELHNDALGGNDKVTLSDLSDTFFGGSGDDTIRGGKGDDRIDGGDDNDRLFGESGSDIFVLSKGSDVIDGGADQDTFDASTAKSAIEANLSNKDFSFSSFSDILTTPPADLPKNTYRHDGENGSLSSIEFINSTGFNDVIIGGSETNNIDGGNGNDFIVSNSTSTSTELKGQSGNDTLVGGTKSDHLIGGQDDDVLYSWNPDATTPDNKDTLDGGGGTDTYYVDGLPDNSAGQAGSTDFISNWEVGEKAYWLGAGTPTRHTTFYESGKQHLTMLDENGVATGGFSWGNGLGNSENRRIVATNKFIDGNNAIEFFVEDVKPTAFDEVKKWAEDNRTAICTGKSLFDGLKSIIELRAQAKKIVSKAFAQTLDTSDLGEDGFGKFARAWFPDADDTLVASALEERYVGIFHSYLELLEEKIIQEIKKFTSIKELSKKSVKKIIEELTKEYCPALPEEIWFAQIGELAISPIPVANATLGIGKSLLNSMFTFFTAEVERVQKEEIESLGTGIEIFYNGNGIEIIEREDSDREAAPTENADMLILGAGDININGSPTILNGDRIFNFSNGDSITISTSFKRGDFGVTFGSAILDIDTDQDDLSDTQITLEGDFTTGDFMAVGEGDTTTITFESFLPALQDGQALDPALINGILNQTFLKGDGSSGFQVTLRDMGRAAFDNVVGVYEIDTDGNIIDTRILFDNANANKTAVADIADVEAGNLLGFFLVQDAADWAATLAADDGLSFVNGAGAAANIADGSDISIAVNGVAVDEMVFHSFSEDMNLDGVQHALSGVDVGGQSISVGFEDLFGGGDRDYEDVVFRIEVLDDF